MPRLDLTPFQLELFLQTAFAAEELISASSFTGDAQLPVIEALQQLQEVLHRADARCPLQMCVVCGKRFEALNSRKRTCSDRCRQRLSRGGRSKRTTPPATPPATP